MSRLEEVEPGRTWGFDAYRLRIVGSQRQVEGQVILATQCLIVLVVVTTVSSLCPRY